MDIRKLTFFLAFIIIALAVVINFAGNTNFFAQISGKNQGQNNKLQVVASFYPMYFFASEIAGEKANVYNLTPAGAEPHDFEPTTRDILKINQSRMLVLNGNGLEPWGDRIKNQLKGSKVLVVTAGENLATKNLSIGGKVVRDPHVWLDPVLAKEEVRKILKGYEEIDPGNINYFRQNAKILEDKLDRLNAQYEQGLKNCRKNTFITAHEAFSYLAIRYGLNQVSITGISPEEEPSAQKLAEITKLVKEENIKVIFFETLLSPRLSQTIASETGAKTMVLDPIEGISAEDTAKGYTYFTVMSENLANLETALQCSK